MKRWGFIALVAVSASMAFGCGKGEETETLSRPLISDGAHGGTPGFFFLPPIAPLPRFRGSFAANLEPVVKIDELDTKGKLIRPIATFTTRAGRGSERILPRRN